MSWKLARLPLLLLCLLALACASSDRLAQQSEKEMQGGHVQKAYDKARSSLQKDRSNDRARAAMAAAGAQLLRQRQNQIVALATAADTLGAADRAVDLDAFRRELADYSVSLPPDDAFAAAEKRIRAAAAVTHYRRGREQQDAGQPKHAYNEFVATRNLEPGYKDVDARIQSAYEDAVSHIAILPFENQTDVRGLSMELAQKVQTEVERRITPRDFRFTVILGREAVYAKIPVAALTHLDRADALRIGRDLGADQVIVGRFFGLHAQTNSATYHQAVSRRQRRPAKEGSPSAEPLESWLDDEITVARRERDVKVQYEFSVFSTDNGDVLATRSATVSASAVTIYTDFNPAGSCDDYFLYRPDLKTNQPEVASRIEHEWQSRCGNWKLTVFLERAKTDRQHTRYRSADRQLFYNFSRDNPVYLGDLPPEEDLAIVALDRVWDPVLAVLRELEK